MSDVLQSVPVLEWAKAAGVPVVATAPTEASGVGRPTALSPLQLAAMKGKLLLLR